MLGEHDILDLLRYGKNKIAQGRRSCIIILGEEIMKKVRIVSVCVLVLTFLAMGLLSGCLNVTIAPTTTTEETTTAAPETTTTTTTAAETTAAQEEETTDELLGSVSSFTSLEEYLSNSTVKASLDAVIESMEAQGISLDITAQGNTMVYTYTYQEQLDLSDPAQKDAMVNALDSAMESQKDTFETSLNQIRSVINPQVTIKIVYLNNDGSEIATYNFG